MMIRKNMFIADRYEIIDKVGSGGMSDVYKALDHKLNRYVAVKVLKDEFSGDKSFVTKFKVEAQSAAGLAHPNIVNVFDVSDENGIYFIVMELVEGITLKKYIEKKGKLPVREAVSIAIQIAQGIEAAHNNHIIHRDIKPQNVIISREGKVKVTDFGIARAATANTINSNAMGSVHYISPEQARGGYIDEKSDIYSLGISLYEMLAGKVPFEGDSTVTIALQHINEELPSLKREVPELPVSVEKIIEKCTQKKSELRYPKVTALIADLKRSLITPDEDFVVLPSVTLKGDTIMMTDEEVNNIRRGANANNLNSYKESDDIDEDDDIDDEDYDIDDDIDSSNPKYDKLLTIGAIVMSVVFIVMFVLVIVNIMKSCDNQSNDPFKESSSQSQTSISSKQTIVPDVCNYTDSEAQKILNDAELGIGREYEYSNHVAEGYVIRQSIPEGEVVDKHTKVVVVISNGSKKFEIPSIKGMTREEAIALLTNDTYGLNVKVSYEANEDIEAEGCIRTNPTFPTQLNYGDDIELFVSSGPDDTLVTVPELLNKNFEELKQQVEALGLELIVEKSEYHEQIVEGNIISSEYEVGKSLPKGTKINVVVSLGVEPTEETTTEEPTTEEPTTEEETTTEEPTTEEPTTEEPTTETPTEMVKKTEVHIKAFNDGQFNIPVVTAPVEGGEEGATTSEPIKEGKLVATLIVNHGKETRYNDIQGVISSEYTPGYTQARTTIEIEETGVTDATFMVTLVYVDADGTEKQQLVYSEKNCITEESEHPVEVN